MAKRDVPGIAGRLADFSIRLNYGDLSPEVVLDAKKGVLDTLGVALVGSQDEGTRKVGKVLDSLGGSATSTVLGSDMQAAPTMAAMLNGYAAHVLDYDDTQHNCGTHMSAPVLPAALVIAEMYKRSGRDLLTAYVAGFEVGCRLARAARYGRVLADRGIHATGFLGHIGAAAAAGKLLGLDVTQMQRNFGIGASQSSGLMRSFGTMCKGLNAGNAAQDAVFSTLLANQGFTGPEEIFDGKQNLFALIDCVPDAEEMFRDLGTHFEITHNTLKIFACAGWRNPIAEAVMHIAATHKLEVKDVARIRILAWTRVMTLPNYPLPGSGLEAKFSAQHVAAVALIDRAGGVAQFSDERVRDPVLAELTGRVTIVGDETLEPYQIRVIMDMVDGRELTYFIPAQKGDPRNPLSWDDVVAKFSANATGVLPQGNADRICAMVKDIESLSDIAQLTRLCRPGQT